MKKCVNGKIVEMNDNDIVKRNTRLANRNRTNESNLTRIKELEEAVANLTAKLGKTQTAEAEDEK